MLNTYHIEVWMNFMHACLQLHKTFVIIIALLWNEMLNCSLVCWFMQLHYLLTFSIEETIYFKFMVLYFFFSIMKQYTGCMIPYKKELEASKMYPISQQIWTILIRHLWVFLRQLHYNYASLIVSSTEDSLSKCLKLNIADTNLKDVTVHTSLPDPFRERSADWFWNSNFLFSVDWKCSICYCTLSCLLRILFTVTVWTFSLNIGFWRKSSLKMLVQHFKPFSL